MTAGTDAGRAETAVAEPVAAYKRVLRRIIDKRPSGMRLKLATALRKHKSFVSQITNPAYPVPVPARHVEAIMEICRFSPDERTEFLEAYARAHPDRVSAGADRAHKTIMVEVPRLDDPRKQAALEDLIRDFARRAARLLD